MAHNKGIDISRYQGAPDFAKVKKEVDFVIMQAGYGRYATQKDAQFERSYEQCERGPQAPFCLPKRSRMTLA